MMGRQIDILEEVPSGAGDMIFLGLISARVLQ